MSFVNPTPDSELDAERSARSQSAQVPSNELAVALRALAFHAEAICSSPTPSDMQRELTRMSIARALKLLGVTTVGEIEGNAPETFVQPTRERLLDLATELARYFTSGNPIAVERATVRRESDLYLLLRECMPNWQFEPLKAHELKASEQQCTCLCPFDRKPGRHHSLSCPLHIESGGEPR